MGWTGCVGDERHDLSIFDILLIPHGCSRTTFSCVVDGWYISSPNILAPFCQPWKKTFALQIQRTLTHLMVLIQPLQDADRRPTFVCLLPHNFGFKALPAPRLFLQWWCSIANLKYVAQKSMPSWLVRLNPHLIAKNRDWSSTHYFTPPISRNLLLKWVWGQQADHPGEHQPLCGLVRGARAVVFFWWRPASQKFERCFGITYTRLLQLWPFI